eukprot:scaffold71223_cov36-Tisochrysis_lutea.AAC.2
MERYSRRNGCVNSLSIAMSNFSSKNHAVRCSRPEPRWNTNTRRLSCAACRPKWGCRTNRREISEESNDSQATSTGITNMKFSLLAKTHSR